MKPSRTYTLGVLGVVAELLLAMTLIIVMAIAPEHLGTVAPVLGELGMYCAACAGAGAGAMSLRDYGSGGLTSSQAEHIIEHARGPTND